MFEEQLESFSLNGRVEPPWPLFWNLNSLACNYSAFGFSDLLGSLLSLPLVAGPKEITVVSLLDRLRIREDCHQKPFPPLFKGKDRGPYSWLPPYYYKKGLKFQRLVTKNIDNLVELVESTGRDVIQLKSLSLLKDEEEERYQLFSQVLNQFLGHVSKTLGINTELYEKVLVTILSNMLEATYWFRGYLTKTSAENLGTQLANCYLEYFD